jgi:hypothetical protein
MTQSRALCRPPGFSRDAVLSVTFAIATLTAPHAAHAQVFGQLLESEIPLETQTGRNRGVRERQRPESSPQGLPAGGFRIYPEIGGGGGYTDNVVGAEIDQRSDAFVDVQSRLTARSQWARHSLIATASYDGRRFINTPRRNEDGFLLSVDSVLEIVGDSQVAASLSYRRTFEQQTEGSFPANGGGAIGVNQPRALVRGSWALNRLRLTGSTDVNRFEYLPTVTAAGRPLDLGFRDRTVTRGSGRAEFELTPDNAVFGQATYRRTDYDLKNALTDRSSDEWRVLGGAIADVTNLIRLAGAVGYFHRTYDNPLFGSIGGLALDVRADYFLTPLTTISAIASRQVEEAVVVGSPGYLSTRVGARVDHELLRNLIPYALVEYADEPFREVDRQDRRFRIAAGADWTLRRTWAVTPTIDYISRTSRGAQSGPSINELRALISVRIRP